MSVDNDVDDDGNDVDDDGNDVDDDDVNQSVVQNFQVFSVVSAFV